ncbi:MAG: carbohydrate ABC transporter substrate-binding protein [Eubacterium sp.]|nr:carbohydrate ABC transporter substrate-binding protein [Eubacterium sp.]
MQKRILAALLASAMLVGIAGCESTASTSDTGSTGGDSKVEDSKDSGDASTGGDESTGGEENTGDPDPGKYIEKMTLAEGEGTHLNIQVWNEEWKDYFDKYIAPQLPDGVTYDFTITPSDKGAYQNKLDADLPDNVGKDDPIDIFLFEADYALKYVDADVTLDVKELGITDADLSEMYQYTVDVATDKDGKLKGLSWQATPGLFAYRARIAEDVLGTSDPAEVQEALSSWDKFNKVAADASAKGYKMLSGYDDSYRVFSNNVSQPWVDAEKNIIVDDQLMAWVDQTKEFTEKKYNNQTSLWSDAWTADQGPGADVFGFFYSTWGINFTLMGNSLETPEKEGGKPEVGNGEYGEWKVCEGPANYFWGGTWIAAANGTDNKNLVGQILKQFTCNEDFMRDFTKVTLDYTNNKAAMKSIAEDKEYGSAFLGGQNHVALFYETAPNIKMDKSTKYDQLLNENFQTAFKDYFNGTIDKETALKNFYALAQESYADLKVPA